MKAVIIKNDGFRKYIDIQKRVPMLSTVGMSSVNIYPLDQETLKDIEVPITTYQFNREYEDDFNNLVLVYLETP